jgi:hypothetical protein
MKFNTLNSSIRNRIDKKSTDRIILYCLESIFDNGVCMDCTKYSLDICEDFSLNDLYKDLSC